MLDYSTDTIAAVATPSGRGGVGIVRVSGPATRAIADAILGSCPPPRYARYQSFYAAEGTALDEGIALFFPGPNSFTGEDVLELQGHGGPVLMDMLLQRCLELGARPARPGEFSERAFLNDKLDLVQAEAIADLIDSGSQRAARCALRSLQGDFSKAVDAVLERLIAIRTYVEAALDFPEEEVDFLADSAVSSRLDQLEQDLGDLLAKAGQGSLLREGLHLVIAGRPNAGKSSLLNALAGHEAAIVTDVAGTTRDVLREWIQIDGMPVHVIDTAGLRESDDPVEQEGIRRAWKEIEKADLVLLLIDASQGFTAEDEEILQQLPEHLPVIEVYNKIDLTGAPPSCNGNKVWISARTGSGVDALKQLLEASVGYESNTEGLFTARRRHLRALESTLEAIERAKHELASNQAGELVAEELRVAQEKLGSITGRFTSDDLLGEIFTSFCIGK